MFVSVSSPLLSVVLPDAHYLASIVLNYCFQSGVSLQSDKHRLCNFEYNPTLNTFQNRSNYEMEANLTEKRNFRLNHSKIVSFPLIPRRNCKKLACSCFVLVFRSSSPEVFCKKDVLKSF